MIRHRRRGTVGAAIAAGLLLAGGCFFSPRDAEDPNTVDPGVGEDAKTPEEVTTKIQSSLGDWNDTEFLRMLSEDFVFRPDRSDSTDLADAGAFPFAEAWGPDDEELVLNRLQACFNDGVNKAGSMVFTYKGEQVFTDSSVTGFSSFETDYRLGIIYGDLQADKVDSLVFDGALKLFIRDEGDGTYAAYRWDDFRKGENSTWGFYKGQVSANQEYCPE